MFVSETSTNVFMPRELFHWNYKNAQNRFCPVDSQSKLYHLPLVDFGRKVWSDPGYEYSMFSCEFSFVDNGLTTSPFTEHGILSDIFKIPKSEKGETLDRIVCRALRRNIILRIMNRRIFKQH
jgi:hypothetical protein